MTDEVKQEDELVIPVDLLDKDPLELAESEEDIQTIDINNNVNINIFWGATDQRASALWGFSLPVKAATSSSAPAISCAS